MYTVLSVIFTTAAAHSWVHCTDYRGPKDYYDSNQCFGNVRPIERNPGDIIVPAQVAFGQDQGFNRNTADGNPDFRPVDGKCQSTVTNQMAGGNYPMATYQRGQRVTLAWPAKNHVAEGCTNRFIPDEFVKVFVEPYKNAQGNRFNQEVDGTWRDRHVNGQIDFKGFQNCPKFCENTDKALCTGDFTVPDLPNGKYSFQWLWKFNPQDGYVTCWEAEIVGEAPGNPKQLLMSTDGCHMNLDKETCMAAVDVRDDYRGVRCAWCCGEFCNKDATGGNGGDNRCEPVTFLEQQAGVTAYMNNEVNQCPQPTTSPTPEPTVQPTISLPTQFPSPSPTQQMMAPDPVQGSGGNDALNDALNDAINDALNGQTDPAQAGTCAPNLMLCKMTTDGMEMEMPCCAGLECVEIGNGISQCMMGDSVSAALGGDDDDGGFDLSENGVMIIAGLLVLCALCCCGAVILMWRMTKSKDLEAYRKQESWESTDRERYSDRHDRRRKKKRSKGRSGFNSERRGEASHKKRTGNPNSATEYISDEPTPGDLPRQSTRV